jgi:SAM-dependent methyltransferase
MTDLTSNGVRLLALLALQALWLGPAHSQPGASPKIEEQLSIQEGIYRSRGDAVPDGYVIDRSLLSYTFTLSDGFDDSLANLGPSDRWLDVGAGQGQAILDYYSPSYDSMHVEGRERRGTKARSIAISIEDRRTPLWNETAAGLEASKIQYLFGKRLRDYTLQDLGNFRLITDVIGGFSYSTNLSRFMENVLDFLELNGSFYSLLQDVSSEAGTNKPFYPGAPFLTEIKNADGSELKVCSWLKSISCVEVTCELRTGWKPPIEVYRVKKVCSDVRVPTLTPVHFAAGTPPERGYRLDKPSPSPSAPAGAAR